MKRLFQLWIAIVMAVAGSTLQQTADASSALYALDYHSAVDPALQRSLQDIDTVVLKKHRLTTAQSAVGLFDLKGSRLAMIHPDRIDYAASVPKIGILLAYFHLHPEASTRLEAQTRHELGLMVKISSNEMAAKYSRQLGLKRIQEVLNSYQLYDPKRGGGIWVGKHYGKDGERYPDPVGGHSHAATVRQLLRFYLLLEQGKLISPEASKTMREIFLSPQIPHNSMKFIKGLEGREREILRKSGSWDDWLHDTAIVRGPDRHYILVALTRHPGGDAYLVDLAAAVDDLIGIRSKATH